MSVFSEISNALDIKEVMEFYGIKISHGKAICPFHNDKHPSMTFKYSRYRCWSCGATGSSIDFVKELLNISVLEAAKQLNKDFHLNMDLNKPI